MKIKNVITHVITADLEVPFKFSQGYCYQRSSVIVEVVGADGTSGFGECMCHGQQPPQLAAAFIDHCYRDLVIGENSLDAEVLWERLYNRVRPFGQMGSAINALSGLDIAFWDLNGKELGQPVSRLLGGRFRERVTAYATGFYRTDRKSVV